MTFKDLRLKCNLELKEAALLIGVKEKTLYKYEINVRLPRWETLKRMSEVYNVNLTTIVNVYDYHISQRKSKDKYVK